MRIVSFKKHIVYLIIVAIIVSSCSNNEREINRYKALNESLESSNNIIRDKTEISYKSLEEKAMDPKTVEIAKIWGPNAKLIKQYTDRVISYIDSVRGILLERIMLQPKNNQTDFDYADMRVTNALFNTQNQAEQIENGLEEYRQAILEIDPEIKVMFDGRWKKNAAIFLNDSMHKRFSKTFFKDVNAIAALTILNEFKNIIRICENETVTFCDAKTGYIIDRFESFGAIISQSSSYVKAGDKVTISTGVGAFSSAAIPKITVQGRNVTTLDGRADYTFKASDEVGKHIVPVKIKFKDQNGVDREIVSDVEYSVVKECE